MARRSRYIPADRVRDLGSENLGGQGQQGDGEVAKKMRPLATDKGYNWPPRGGSRDSGGQGAERWGRAGCALLSLILWLTSTTTLCCLFTLGS